MTKIKILKRVTLIIWLLILITIWIYYLYNPSFFKPDNIAKVLSQYKGHIFIIYTIIGILRGFSLLPNLSFVIAGTILFPDNQILLLITSVIGIVGSSTIIYFFSEFLDINKFFEKKYPKKIDFIKRKMDKYGIWILLLWAFLPIVPSDLISYVSGTIRFNFLKFLIAFTIGHIIIYLIVIYFSSGIFSFLI